MATSRCCAVLALTAASILATSATMTAGPSAVSLVKHGRLGKSHLIARPASTSTGFAISAVVFIGLGVLLGVERCARSRCKDAGQTRAYYGVRLLSRSLAAGYSGYSVMGIFVGGLIFGLLRGSEVMLFSLPRKW